MLSTVNNSSANVPEFDTIYSNSSKKNFRKSISQENNNPYYTLNHNNNNNTYYDHNFEIANRAFYATINKFTKQSSGDSSKRTSYSFLENWHLHSIYSKSQQTLLGITPVKSSVLLSGDDFMFTPSFNQQERPEDETIEDLLDDDDEEWDTNPTTHHDFYHLSICANTPSDDTSYSYYQHQNDLQSYDDYDDQHHDFYRDVVSYPSQTLFESPAIKPDEYLDDTLKEDPYWYENQESHSTTYSPIVAISIPPPETVVTNSPPSPCPSLDDQASLLSTSPSNEKEEDKLPTSSSFSSRKSLEDDRSVVSYQSLADLMQQQRDYGSVKSKSVSITIKSSENAQDDTTAATSRFIFYIMYLWYVLTQFLTNTFRFGSLNPEQQPLL